MPVFDRILPPGATNVPARSGSCMGCKRARPERPQSGTSVHSMQRRTGSLHLTQERAHAGRCELAPRPAAARRRASGIRTPEGTSGPQSVPLMQASASPLSVSVAPSGKTECSGCRPRPDTGLSTRFGLPGDRTADLSTFHPRIRVPIGCRLGCDGCRLGSDRCQLGPRSVSTRRRLGPSRARAARSGPGQGPAGRRRRPGGRSPPPRSPGASRRPADGRRGARRVRPTDRP